MKGSHYWRVQVVLVLVSIFSSSSHNAVAVNIAAVDPAFSACNIAVVGRRQALGGTVHQDCP